MREGGKEEEGRGGVGRREWDEEASASFLPCACKLYIGGVAHKVYIGGVPHKITRRTVGVGE